MLGILVYLLGLLSLHPTQPAMIDDNMDKLYAVLGENAEVVMSTETDSVEASNSVFHTEPNQFTEVDKKDANLGAQVGQMAYYGCFELTAYIETGNPCADGVYPQVGYTAACNDKNLWHKWVHIEGYGDYYIHDTGGMANNVIDIFMASYDEAIQFGRRKGEVYIIE